MIIPPIDKPRVTLRVVQPGETAPPTDVDANGFPALPLNNVHGSYCTHGRTLVDANARSVTCAACKVVLDPIAVLHRLALDWDRHAWARGEFVKLGRDIAAMKTELKNLRAQKRRLDQ